MWRTCLIRSVIHLVAKSIFLSLALTVYRSVAPSSTKHGVFPPSPSGAQTQGRIFLVGWDFWYCGHYWPIVPAPYDRWWWLWRNWWNKDWQGKPKYSEKTCPSATLSTTNPTWLNPGRRGGKPATNRLSYGAALLTRLTERRTHAVRVSTQLDMFW
jgi:hypothetical protein